MPKKIKNFSTRTAKNQKFTETLLFWGKLNGRKGFPWSPSKGKQYDPYKVWVSEIMLQQTQLKTGIKFFKEFIKIFPSIEYLANSNLENVLSVWSGLGYYSRAKNLHNAALLICSSTKKEFPKNAKEWEKLPGVGFSTAASISSFVNHEKVAVMDANVIRIFSRQFMIEECIGSSALKKNILQIANKFLPVNSSDMPIYTQSIMDLGSIICRPKNPKCDLCPVSDSCAAFKTLKVFNYPIRRQNIKREKKYVNWLVPHTNESVALIFLKNTKLWSGLWTPIQIIDQSQMPKNALFVKKFKTPISNFMLEISIWSVLCTNKSTYKSAKWFDKKDLLNGPVPSTVKHALSSNKFFL
tara:strand:+ start:531 stop:1592 length:1062 start_codon:yes stop_codon:yes gene_type:complete